MVQHSMLFVWWYNIICNVCLVVQTLSVVCLVVHHALLSVWWYSIICCLSGGTTMQTNCTTSLVVHQT